jgi:PAS domain S-box-containing protein
MSFLKEAWGADHLAEQDKRARVVLAADDVGSLLRLAALLGDAGYQVEICNDGPSVPAAARACKPDLVVLCATVTAWDVFATAHALKADSVLGQIPLLIVARSWDAALGATGREYADDLLAAPYSDRELLFRLEGLLRLRKERGELKRLQAELAALGRMSVTVRSLPRQDHLLRTALQAVLEVIEVESGAVFLLRPEHKLMELAISKGVSKELERLIARLPYPGELGSIIKEQTVAILPVSINCQNGAGGRPAARPSIYRPALLNEGYAVYGYVSLLAGDQVMGLIAFGSRQARLFTEWDIHLLTAIGHQVGQTLESAKLYSAVRESEERYRVLAEEAPVGIFIVRGGDLIYTNKRFQEAWPGGAPTSVSEMAALEPSLDRARALRQALLQPELHGLNPLEFEAAHPQGGASRWFVLRIAPVRYAGQPAHLGTLLDITEQKRIERALLRTEKLHSLGQMAGGIAHNFNNILAGIQGYLDLAKQDMGDAAELRRDLHSIELGAHDAAQAVRRLQSLYRPIEDISDFVSLSLNDLVGEALALTRPRWRDEQQRIGQTVEIETEFGDLPVIAGNAGELREVLTNLLLNAVEAMPSGGRISIKTARQGDGVSLTIRDSGVGMTPDQLARIWEPFYTTKGASGSGLGLAISQRIIERHGGEMSATSALGQGSAFTVSLPLSQAREAAIAPRPTAEVPAGRRILVVDDEPVVADLLGRMLTRAGQEVMVVNSGQNALAALQEQPFSLLITDLGMPDISGAVVIKNARRLYPDMPVILATGWGATITPEQIAEMGASNLLSKPFTYEQLVDLLGTYLQ